MVSSAQNDSVDSKRRLPNLLGGQDIRQSCQKITPSKCQLWCWKYFLAVIFAFPILLQLSCTQVSGQTLGLMRLQHAYMEMEGSSKRNTSRGMTPEFLELLMSHDRSRQRRMLSTVVDFPIGGTANPSIAGLYFTRITIGSPSKEYFVQVDTGSDILWLNCNPCDSCPTATSLRIPLIPYNPDASSTSSPISCRGPVCDSARKITDATCNPAQNCGYRFLYGDGSTTEGYFVTDTLVYSAVVASNTFVNAKANIVFGCGNSQSGGLSTSEHAVGGIMGFGQNSLSVISQLASQGKTPRVFAHCLQGADSGGGVLVLGNVVEPGIVYTPIVPAQTHYNVNLRSISVNGISLNVDPSVYHTSNGHGTIFDSGTTLSYITEPAYGPFVKAILDGAPPQAQRISFQGERCFLYRGSVDDAFPSITFHFEGADMSLKAKDYLILHNYAVESPTWCIGWRSSSQLTILGDLALKNKLVVYDIENQQIGWVGFNCSSSVTASATTGFSQSVSSDQFRSDGSSRRVQNFSLFILPITVIFHFLNCKP